MFTYAIDQRKLVHLNQKDLRYSIEKKLCSSQNRELIDISRILLFLEKKC